MPPVRPVAGQVVLVTGAARGIGAESARRLAARGARVALVGLEPERLAQVAGDCPGSVWHEADVTDSVALRAAVDGTVERLGGIDVVVANAGIAPLGFVRTMDPAAFERTLAVNLVAVTRTVRLALPHVIARRGYVLPVASMLAAVHLPGAGAYATAKAGVEAFGNVLRAEVRHLGVGVGVAYFSWIDTEIVRGVDRDELGRRLRALARPPLARTYPVADAAEAVVRGIERRSRVVCHPRWLSVMLAARGLVQPLLERDVASEVPALDATFAAEVARLGAAAASAPVGAGGAADARASAPRHEATPA